MKNIKQISILFIFFAFLSSCSTVDDAKQSQKNQTVTSSKYIPPNRSIKNIYFEGDLNVDLNGEAQSASFKMSIAGEDSLLLTISGPFGISVGKAFSTPQKIVFANALTGDIYTGSPTRENLERAISIALSFKDIVKLFKAQTIENPEEYVHYSVSEANAYEYRGSNTHFERIMTNGSDSLIRSFTRLNKQKQVVLNVDYQNYSKHDGIDFPEKIILNFPTQNSLVVFKFNEIKVNGVFDKPFSFSIGKGTNIINLDEK